MKKYLIIGGIVLGFVAMIIGSILLVNPSNTPRGNQEKVEIIWWKPFQDRTDVAALIEDYQKLRPNVTVRYVKKNINDYEQELLNAIASGNSPDIFTVHNDWLPKQMDKLAAMPDNIISERQYRETFVDVAADDFIKDGKIYAVPLSVDVLALFYNKDILGSAGIFTPPTTWPEVVAAVQKITKQDSSGNFTRSGIAMGASNNVNRAVDILLLLMLQNGTQFYNQTFTSATFDQMVRYNDQSFNPSVSALDYFTQFSRPSKRAYTWNVRSDHSVDAFAQGKLGMMLSYSYMIPTIKDKAPNLNWGVVGMPQPDTSGLKTNFANYWGEAVSKTSTKQDYAWDFLAFVSQKEEMKKYTDKVKVPASRKDLLEEQSKDVEIGVFAENAITARSVYKSDASQFESIILKMIDDVVLRGETPQDAVRDAVSQVNFLLRR
ncbi:MAG TPA: extracellular solute-binding protein [Candidatus Binatia bacterium]|nr:extracellular solute-binding protein [Candidatus Binatia bacterium]